MATSGATLHSIYNRLSSAPEYHPFSADTFSDWSMEAGDIIRVSRDGKHYDSPVHTSQMTWRGQSQISVSSDGNEKRESIAKATKRKYGRNGSGYRNDNHLWQELLDDYNGLYSFFEVTSSRMFVTFSGMYDGLSSDFEVTRSRMAADFHGMYDGLSSEFEVTRSRMRVEFRGMYDGLSSDFEVTRSRMAADFQGKYDGLASSFDVTRSRMAADFQGKYDGLASSFDVTRSRMAADFQGKYDGLASSFDVTRSRMAADFQGKYDGLSSEFEVTRSQFHVDLVNSYNQLSSGIEAAANYSMLYTNGKTSRAYIMTQINSNTEQTEALINADQILIGTSGNAKVNLANVISLGDNATVLIKKDVTVNETYGANGVKLMMDGTIRGHQLTLIKTGGQEGQYAVKSITSDDIDEMIVKAAIDGNTLRLWQRGADLTKTSGDGIINFSKATSLSGSWGSGEEGDEPLGKFTVTATQNDEYVGSVFTNITYAPGQVTWSATKATIPLYATIGESQATHFVRNVEINAPTVSAPTFALTGTNAGDTNSASATSSNGRGGSPVYLYLDVGSFSASTHKASVTLKASTTSATDAQQNGTRVGYVEVNASGIYSGITVNVPSFSLTGTNAGDTNSIAASASNGNSSGNLYTYLVVGDIDTSTQKIPVTLKVSETSALDAKDNGTRVAYAEVKAPYKVTDGSVVPINFGNPPTGWTKHEFTAGGSKYQYHTKNGTSGSGTNVLVYFIPRLTVDGSVLNPGTAIYRSNSTIPTQIWHDAYEDGVTAGRVGYTANSSLQAPYGTALDENTEDKDVTITANSKDSTLELATGTYRPSGTTTDRKCVIAKIGSTTVARIGFDWKYTQTEYNNAEANFKNKIHHLTPDSARNHVDIDIKGNKRWGSGSSVAGCSIGPNGKQYWNVKIYDSSGNELHYEQTDQITSGFIIDQKNVTVTANGTYRIADAVAFVVVDVPTGGGGSSYPNSIKMNLYNSVKDGQDWIYYWYSTNKSAGVTQGHSKIFHY